MRDTNTDQNDLRFTFALLPWVSRAQGASPLSIFQAIRKAKRCLDGLLKPTPVVAMLALMAGMPAYAQTQATDNFDRANGGLGVNWTAAASGSAAPQIANNQLSVPSGNYGESLYTGASFGGEQFSEVQYASGLSGAVTNLVVRARQYTSTNTQDGYVGQLNGFGGVWRIIRVDNQVETELASGALTYTSGDTFYFEASGSTLTVKKNGVALGSVSDAAYTTGDVGLGIYDTGTLRVDNWRGGEIASGDTTAPSTPSGLSATAASATQINLSWSASTDNVGVTGYLIERCQGASCSNFAQIATPATASFNNTGLTASTSYTYRIRARDAANNLSSYSSTATTITQPPSGVQATDSFDRANGGLGVNWTAAASGSAALQIASNQLSVPGGNYGESLYTGASFGSTQFSQVKYLTGLTSSVINLVVRARQYSSSNTEDAYLAQLNGFSNTWRILRVDDQVETELVSGALTYSNSDTFYFEASGSTLTIKKNGVTLGTANDANYSAGDVGVGIYSPDALRLDDWAGGEIGTSGDTTAPSAPGGLSATAISATQINLSWSASTDNVGVTGYLIERCQGSSCSSFAQIATPTTTSFNDTGLTASTGYSYRVRARDAANNLSSYSSTASATTQPAGGTQATDNFDRANGGLGVNWTAAASGSAALQIASNQLSVPSGNYGESLYTGASFGGAQFSEVQYANGLSGAVLNLVVRARQYTSTNTQDGYVGQLNGFGGVWRIIRVDNQVETELVSGALTYTSGDTFYFEASGSTLTVKKNGVALGSVSDATYTTGDVGLGIYDTSTLRVDNWRGGEIASGDTTAPSTPSGLSATAASATQINLSWSASTDNVGVTGYLIERCQGASCSSFAQIATPTTTSFNDTGLTASTNYSYRVRARDTTNNLSSYSSTATAVTSAAGDTQAPSAPGGLSATAASASQLNLSWAASTDNVGVTGYLLERCQGTSCSSFAQVATPTTTTYSDTGLAASTSYSYRLRAKDAANNLSSYSVTATAVTQAPPNAPTAPSGLTAIATSSTEIDFRWNASTGGTGSLSYLIERCQGANCSTFAQVGSSGTLLFYDAALTAATNYSYRIRAIDGASVMSGYSVVFATQTLAVASCD